MSDEDKGLIVVAILFLSVVAVASFGFTRAFVNGAWKADMVKRGFAEYSQTTGEWQWKKGGE